jgi:DNA repair protein RadC
MKYLKKLNIKLVRGEYQNPVKGQVREPSHIYRTFKAIKDSAQELLIGVYLNADLEVLTYDTLSVGGESATLVVPREIFGRAFVMRAKSFVLIHNHPSGGSHTLGRRPRRDRGPQKAVRGHGGHVSRFRDRGREELLEYV